MAPCSSRTCTLKLPPSLPPPLPLSLPPFSLPKENRSGWRTYKDMYVYADGVLELEQGAVKYRAAFYDSPVKPSESNAYVLLPVFYLN